jgi:hypothetical protein
MESKPTKRMMTRPSPRMSAAEVPGQLRKGNDGSMWRSSQCGSVYRWKPSTASVTKKIDQHTRAKENISHMTEHGRNVCKSCKMCEKPPCPACKECAREIRKAINKSEETRYDWRVADDL